MAVSINDSVALVTGGARGIGAAIAGCTFSCGARFVWLLLSAQLQRLKITIREYTIFIGKGF